VPAFRAPLGRVLHQRAKIVVTLAKINGDIIGLTELQNLANDNGGTYTKAALSDLTASLTAATGSNCQVLGTINSANLVAGDLEFTPKSTPSPEKNFIAWNVSSLRR